MADESRPMLLAPCNQCLRVTNHHVLWKESVPWQQSFDEDENVAIWGEDNFSTLKCAGCDQIRLLHAHWFSEDTDDKGCPVLHTEYFPPTITRQKPLWRRSLAPFHSEVFEKIDPLLDEIYSAHAVGAYTLAVMGIRALAEKIMIEKVGEDGGFAKIVDRFFCAGFVAPVQQNQFKSVLVEAGHAAVHRSFKPTREDMEFLLDQIETLIEVIYYQPLRASSLSKKLPVDQRRVKQAAGTTPKEPSA